MFRIFAVSTAAWLAIGLASTAGCGSNTPAILELPYPTPAANKPPIPLRVDAPFFIPGEEMSWDLSTRGILGGKAVMAMGKPGIVDGRNVIVIRSQTETAGAVKLIKEVCDDIITWVDLDSSLPIYLHAELKFGKRETLVETRFRKAGYDVEYLRRNKKNAKPLKRRQNLPPDEDAYDSHSLLGVVRAWTPEDGTRAYFFAVAGRRLWHNTIQFTGRETVRTGMGMFPTVRLDGVATPFTRKLTPSRKKKPRSYTLWITDDANRMPLRFVAHTEYGDVEAELVRYHRPERVLARH